MTDEYVERNHPTLASLQIKDCYLCGKSLEGDTRPDHIIPNSLFASGSPNRPKLPVHHACNNSKSKDDEWFLRQLQLMCSLNPEAYNGLKILLDRAKVQRPDAYVIGRSNKIRDYKLAVSLLDKNVFGMQVVQRGVTLSTLNIGNSNTQKAAEYMKTLCRGLYIRNVAHANPARPRLIGIQYAKAIADDKYNGFMDTARRLMEASTGSGFYQEWKGRVLYGGSQVAESKDKGFLFIEFYGEVGFLATFE
jgi:hypothetical protein